MSNETVSLEEKLAQISAGVNNNLRTLEVGGERSAEYSCPVDPDERAQCEGCQ